MPAASMPLNGKPTRADAGPNGLKLFLVIVSVAQVLNALLHLSILLVTLFGETQSEVNGTTAAQAAIGSLVAIAALIFALKGWLRHAIVAVAAIGLMDWLSDLPFLAYQGLSTGASFKSLSALFHLSALPAFCIAAIAFAARDVRLGWAAVMAAMPLIVDILLVIGLLLIGVAS